MKSFLLLFFLTATLLFGAPNWAPGYAEAFEKATKEDKGVMIMLSKENCNACWYMENIVFEDAALVEELEKHFIPLYLDVHDDDIHGLTYIGTPTFYFMTNGGETIKRLVGVYNIKEMSAALSQITEGNGADQ